MARAEDDLGCLELGLELGHACGEGGDAHRVRLHDLAQRVAVLLCTVLGRRPSGDEFG